MSFIKIPTYSYNIWEVDISSPLEWRLVPEASLEAKDEQGRYILNSCISCQCLTRISFQRSQTKVKISRTLVRSQSEMQREDWIPDQVPNNTDPPLKPILSILDTIVLKIHTTHITKQHLLGPFKGLRKAALKVKQASTSLVGTHCYGVFPSMCWLCVLSQP